MGGGSSKPKNLAAGPLTRGPAAADLCFNVQANWVKDQVVGRFEVQGAGKRVLARAAPAGKAGAINPPLELVQEGGAALLQLRKKGAEFETRHIFRDPVTKDVLATAFVPQAELRARLCEGADAKGALLARLKPVSATRWDVLGPKNKPLARVTLRRGGKQSTVQVNEGADPVIVLALVIIGLLTQRWQRNGAALPGR